MSGLTLSKVESIFDTALMPQDVFKEHEYKKLVVAVHPDKHPNDSERAKDLFKQVGWWHDLAEKPEKAGKYNLGKILGRGDIADVRYSPDCVVKVARTLGVGNLMAKEIEVLKQLNEKSGDSTYSEYFPRPIEMFQLEDKRRVNVFGYEHLCTAEQIKNCYNNGVDGRHIVWMFKRILTAIGYAHGKGWVHGAVLPPHLLFNLYNHGLKLCDWTLAVKFPSHLVGVPATYKGWYPDECKNKGRVDQTLDIYLAARTMLWLAEKDIPAKLRLFMLGCTMGKPSMRPQNAWDLLDELDSLARSLYGPPKFVKLELKGF